MARFLLFLVFITGACLLVIEIVAIRILAPFFGNTIYSTSSVIGVVLGFLSLGYYWGGIYSDKNSNLRAFFRIIFYSGLTVLISHIGASLVLPVYAFRLPITYGPLISSLFLFSAPSFLLASLSPFAINIYKNDFPKLGIGKITGRVFFASTVGSIFGSLLTGFYLIPFFGISHILFGVGFLLTIVGLLGLIHVSKVGKTLLVFVLGAVSFTTLAVSSSSLETGAVYDKDGMYGKIVVFDAIFGDRLTRFLYQDAGISSAVYVDNAEGAFDYAKYVFIYKSLDLNIKNALFIGGGGYTAPFALKKEVPEATIEVAEIEPTLFAIAKKYFAPASNTEIINYVTDGRRHLVKSTKQYDLIFADAYFSIYSIPAHLTTKEFFNLAKSKLGGGGIFVANVLGVLDEDPDSFVLSEMKTFLQVFPNAYFFAVEEVASAGPQNIMFIGINGNRILQIEGNTLAGFPGEVIDIKKYDLSKYRLLTDDYSPIEAMNVRTIGKKINLR